jgi:hypothetical protein
MRYGLEAALSYVNRRRRGFQHVVTLVAQEIAYVEANIRLVFDDQYGAVHVIFSGIAA